MTTRGGEAYAVAEASDHLSILIGLAAVVFSALYFISDLMESAQVILYGATGAHLRGGGGDPTFVCWFVRTSAAGSGGSPLQAVDMPTASSSSPARWCSRSSTERRTGMPQCRAGWWVTIHGVVMVIAGLAFGLAVIRAGCSPLVGRALMAGVVLVAVPGAARSPKWRPPVRDLAFAGMGTSLPPVEGEACPGCRTPT
jgi:hypothetical protein